MLKHKDQDPDFQDLSSKEWLFTNGLGGYAASTVLGSNTRRYHGLLVAALNPPTGRKVLVSKIEESIIFNRDSAFALSSNQYPGTIHPDGFQYFKFFERKPLPVVKFEAHGCHLLKTVFMVHGSNTTVVEYENTGASNFKLRLTPIFVHRDDHGLNHPDAKSDYWVKRENGYQTLYAHFGAPALYFSFTKGEYLENRQWYYNLEYVREQERGLGYREDACSVASLEVILAPGEKTHLVFSTDEKMMKEDPTVLKTNTIKRQEALTQQADGNAFLRDLLLSGDQFIVHRKSTEGFSLIAGYHWFTDWGRDTMIAMRGLTIATGKQEISKSILETFLRSVDQGMLPNRFPDRPNDPIEYNTIDATLWLFVALYEYHQKFQDLDFIHQYFGVLTEILNQHVEGARFQIKVNSEGFLSGGEGLSQLTWMDARVGDFVVTPRHGAPVEIQALWYNALRIYQYFAGTLQQPFEQFQEIADKLLLNFERTYVQGNGSLADVVDFSTVPPKIDVAIRPNQLYVVSLPFSLLGKDAEKKVVAIVKAHLVTDFGLRTLSPEHADFKPVYAGDPWHRDTAYHQGTVWPFLLSEYITAYLKVQNWSEKAQKEALAMLEPLKKHFYQDQCILGISEVFDGNLPRVGKGTVQQAWSVAALIKVLLELKKLQGKKSSSIPFSVKKSPFQ